MIRPARPADVPQILAMIKELADYEREPDAVVATEESLQRALFTGADTPGGHPAAYCHVVEVDGAVVAMALWFLNYSTWTGRHGIYLEDLYVRPAARGQGWGKALLRHLAAIAVERGYTRVEWWVLTWNEPAIEFYRSQGAIPMDEWTVYRLTGEALHRLGG